MENKTRNDAEKSRIICFKQFIYFSLSYKNMVVDDVRGIFSDSSNPFEGYGKFSLRLIGYAMFRATFNLVTRVEVP